MKQQLINRLSFIFDNKPLLRGDVDIEIYRHKYKVNFDIFDSIIKDSCPKFYKYYVEKKAFFKLLEEVLQRLSNIYDEAQIEVIRQYFTRIRNSRRKPWYAIQRHVSHALLLLSINDKIDDYEKSLVK